MAGLKAISTRPPNTAACLDIICGGEISLTLAEPLLIAEIRRGRIRHSKTIGGIWFGGFLAWRLGQESAPAMSAESHFLAPVVCATRNVRAFVAT